MAVVTRTTIRRDHDEFTKTPDDALDRAIEHAYAFFDETSLGAQYEYAVEWYACYDAATSPTSRDIRAPFEEGIEGYKVRYLEIMELAGRAYRLMP